MAQFYGVLDNGTHHTVTRNGSKRDGIRARACAWRIGVNVNAWHSSGVDRMDIEIDGGSDGARSAVPLFILTPTDTLAEIAGKLRAAAAVIESNASSLHGWPK